MKEALQADSFFVEEERGAIRNGNGEHSHCFYLGPPEKSAVAEHSLANTGHHVLFEET